MRNLGSFRYRGPDYTVELPAVNMINGYKLSMAWNFPWQVYDFDVPCTDSAIVMSRSALALLSQHASCKTLRHNLLQIWIDLLSDAEFKIQGSDREAPTPSGMVHWEAMTSIYLTDRKGRVTSMPFSSIPVHVTKNIQKSTRHQGWDSPTMLLSSFWTLASQDMSIYGLQCHIPGLLRIVHSCPVDSCPRISLPSWECRRGGH